MLDTPKYSNKIIFPQTEGTHENPDSDRAIAGSPAFVQVLIRDKVVRNVPLEAYLDLHGDIPDKHGYELTIRDFIDKFGPNHQIIIITGKGTHSTKKVSRLRKKVEEFLHEMSRYGEIKQFNRIYDSDNSPNDYGSFLVTTTEKVQYKRAA